MKKTYLVTGGAGFIGSNFIHYIADKYGNDIKVINMDSLTYAGNLDNLKGIEEKTDYLFEKVDICDINEVNRVFDQNNIDYVVHFAAESHVDRSIEDPDVFLRTNIIGTNNLLLTCLKHWQDSNEEFKGGNRFLYVGTDEVYGSLGFDDTMFTEETPLSPRSPYSVSKTGGDLLTKAFGETYKLPVMVTRCSNNYGPYQFPEKLIPLMINNALKLKNLPVYGKGINVRDWLYVEDHCKAIDLVLSNGRLMETYNVGGHNEMSNIDIVKIIIDLVSQKLPDDDPRKEKINEDLIVFVKDRKGHDLRYAISPDKIHSELGWKPETCFKEGIRKTIKWYMDNQDWMDNITSGEYIKYYEKMYGNR